MTGISARCAAAVDFGLATRDNFSIIDEMRRRDYLGSFELMVLLALMRLGDEAYGVPIARELEATGGSTVMVASVYAALQRLEQKTLVTSRVGDPTAERGGKAKKYFAITSRGIAEVRRTQGALSKLWGGLRQLKDRRT
jgi:DNA-binding PadR family transcriptional regulator